MALKNKYIIEFSSSGVKKTDKDVKKLDKSTKKLSKSQKDLSKATAVAKKALLALGAAITATAAYSIKTAIKFETLKTRLNTLYGSVNKGTKAFNAFNTVAATTPFALARVVEAGAQLKAFGVDAEKNIKGVADLAAFMGVDVVEAAAAMGRAFAGGAGAADVLRDRGVLELIKSFKGIEDLTKLTLPEFREALEEAMIDPTLGIAGATDALSDTVSGAYSNMWDSIDKLANTIGEKFLPVMKDLAGWFGEWADEMADTQHPLLDQITNIQVNNFHMKALIDSLEKTTQGSSMYKSIMSEINREYPDLLYNIEEEADKVLAIKNNYIDLLAVRNAEIQVLRKKYQIEAHEEEIKEILKEQTKARRQLAEQSIRMVEDLETAHLNLATSTIMKGTGDRDMFVYFRTGARGAIDNIKRIQQEYLDFKITPETFMKDLKFYVQNYQDFTKAAAAATGNPITILDMKFTEWDNDLRELMEDTFGTDLGKDWLNENLLVDFLSNDIMWALDKSRLNLKSYQEQWEIANEQIGIDEQIIVSLEKQIAAEKLRLQELEEQYIRISKEKGFFKDLFTDVGAGGAPEIDELELKVKARVAEIRPPEEGTDTMVGDLDFMIPPITDMEAYWEAVDEIKGGLTEKLTALQEELTGLQVMESLFGPDEQRQEQMQKIIGEILSIGDAMSSIPEKAEESAKESLGHFGKFAKGFKNFLKNVSSEEKELVKVSIDAVGDIAMATAGGKESQLKIQKFMVAGNVAKGIMDIWTDPTPTEPIAIAKAVALSASLVAKGASQVKDIDSQIAAIQSEKSSVAGASATFAQYGMNQIVDGATPIVAGEAGAELVQITPLEGPNVDGPQGGSVIITGNVMSKDFVEDELVDQIKESIRRGHEFR